MGLRITLDLSDGDLQHFRRAIQTAKDTLSEVGEPAVIKSAQELIERVRAKQVPAFVSERVEQLALFLEMVQSDVWRIPPEVRTRVLSALAYFSDPHDIIPDDIPGVGFLDDAIMVELVLRELKHQIDAYRDFKSFGSTDKEGRTSGTIDEEKFRERREALGKRARRRERRDRERAGMRGTKISLW